MPIHRDDVKHLLATYEQAKRVRQPLESEWQLAAAHCLPANYSSWVGNGPSNAHTSRKAAARLVYDSTGLRSLPKYTSVLERLLTPASQKWHTLTASDDNLKKSRPVREYFDALTNLMFKKRYDPKARFRSSFSDVYTSMGVYGNGPIFIGERKPTHIDKTRGLKYISCAMQDTFAVFDDEGDVYGMVRRMWLNCRQFKIRFPDVTPPKIVKAEADKPTPDEMRYFEFIHYVRPREEGYDPRALNATRHPYVGSYVAVDDKEYIGEDEGYMSQPYKMPRVATVSGLGYGYSPALLALPSMGGASGMKKTNLKQGNKAVDPVLLAHDDGVTNGTVDMRPGAINYGGVDSQGRLLIQPLTTGNFRVGEVLLQDERRDVEDSFFVTLFQILNDTPEMTATEVMERMAEKAALLSPTMGRGHSELLGPTIEREIEVLTEMGVAPPMPPELIEAQGEYEAVYTSPLAKAMYAEEIGGYMRTVEMAMGVSNATQDPSHLDHFNFDVAFPEIADNLSAPTRWMNDEKTLKTLRSARDAKAQMQTAVDAAPSIASVAKGMQA